MRRVIFLSLFISIILTGIAKSQDANFSQFFSTPLYLSPSLAGANEQSRLIANYRNQWPGIPNSFVNYVLSFDHYLPDFKSGIGAMLLRTSEGGVYNTTNLGVYYSYTIDINREIKVRPGIKAGYYFRNIDFAGIDFADEITRDATSSIEIPKEEFIRHYDFASSFLVYTSFYWLGFTGDHLLALNNQFANDPTYPDLKISVYGGARLKLFESVISKTDRTFSIAFLYKTQSGFHQLDLGTYYEEEPFRVGIFFRGVPVFKANTGLNAVVLMAGYNYRQMMINYSYDISTSRLLAATGGAHELSLAYKFQIGWSGKSSKLHAVPCPHF